MVKWPFEDSVQCQPGGNTLHWGKVPQKAVCALNQCPVYGAISTVGFMSLGIIQMESEVAPFATIRTGIILAKLFLLVPVTLCFAGLEILVPEGGMLSPRRHHYSIELEINTTARLLGASYASETAGKKSYGIG